VGEGSETKLAVRPYAAEDKEAWDDLVEQSRSRHFLFRRDYMEYHRDRFEDASLVVADGDALVAALPANREGDEVVSHGGLTFGGLLSGPELTARRTVAVFEALLEYLRADGVRALLYKAVPHIYHRVPAEEDLYALFVHGANLVRRDCSSAVRQDSRLGYTKGRRSAVRGAEKAELQIARDTDFSGFMQMEDEALRRRHGIAPVHSPEEMTLLADRFPENIKLFTARKQGEPLAGAIVYETDAVAHAQYIAGTEQGYAEHALDAVIDHLLETEYGDKRWFDFGISTTEEGRTLNEGLVRNKESYGARAVVYDTYRFELDAG
jgi:hypothetical protein